MTLTPAMTWDCVQLRAGPELGPVDGHRVEQRGRGEVGREGERQAEGCGQSGAEQRRPEDVERHIGTASGNGIDLRDQRFAAQIALQFQDVLREAVRRCVVPPEGAHRRLIRARRPPQPEIDAARVDRGQRAELFGDGEWRMVGQHHPAGAESNGGGVGGDVRDQHTGRRRSDRRHVVMLGIPDAPIAEGLCLPGQRHATGDGVTHVLAFADRGQIQDRQRNVHVQHDLS